MISEKTNPILTADNYLSSGLSTQIPLLLIMIIYSSSKSRMELLLV